MTFRQSCWVRVYVGLITLFVTGAFLLYGPPAGTIYTFMIIFACVFSLLVFLLGMVGLLISFLDPPNS